MLNTIKGLKNEWRVIKKEAIARKKKEDVKLQKKEKLCRRKKNENVT